MTTEKFFVYVQRLNSLIPAGVVAFALVALGIDMIQTRNRNKESRIESPTSGKAESPSASKLDLRIKPTSLQGEDDILILKIVADTRGGSHDRYDEETRNYCF